MKYLFSILLALLIALAFYAFAEVGIMDTFIVGDAKSEHTMADYLKETN